MTNLLIYAIMVTLMSFAILAAYFDGHVFISIRTYFNNLKEASVVRKNALGYFIGYLFTCYFCASYWVSWLVAFGTYKIVFTEPLSLMSSALVIFGTGLFSVAVLDLLSALPLATESEYGAFFPWHDSEEELDISDSIEDTMDDDPGVENTNTVQQEDSVQPVDVEEGTVKEEETSPEQALSDNDSDDQTV